LESWGGLDKVREKKVDGSGHTGALRERVKNDEKCMYMVFLMTVIMAMLDA
jgi:hypothetical protein